MPSYDPTLFNVNPYYDDFNEDKKFLRMLFRPGYAVQSRELTQLQTILQNQVERFGNHIFKDGSNIIGGEISTQTLNFVRIFPETIVSPIFTATAADLVGNRLIQRNRSGDAVSKAVVVDYLPSYSAADPYGVAIISYMSGTEFTAGATVESDNSDKAMQFKIAESITQSPIQSPGQQSVSAAPTGKTHVVAISEGIYYINGFFVKSMEQLEPAFTITNEIRNFDTPTGIMGFDVQSTIVTEKDDFTIKDPANGSYNYNAPGAHRFKIDLALKFVETETDPNFIQLVFYSDGEILKKIEKTEYADIINLFAQRTYDESGNYVVNPFDISFRDGNGTTAYADVGSGKAYVFGYEYETKFKDVVEVPRAQTVGIYEDYSIDNYFGNYIIGQYSPNGTNINYLFSEVNAGIGEKTLGYSVYGATAMAGVTNYNDIAIFGAMLFKMEPDGVTNYSTQGQTMQFKAYVSNITQINATGGISHPVNLYLYSYETGVSHKLLNNIELYRSTYTTSQSRLPKFSDFDSQSLIFPINGETPTTMVKEVTDLSYLQTTFKGFIASSSDTQPSVALAMGEDFNWSFNNGFIPNGNDVVLDESDGYYVVYASGSAMLIGTVLRIVGPNITVPTGQTKVTAKITDDGDYIQFTSSLPVGSYYLVGKAKNITADVQTNTSTKIRTKTSASNTETITDEINSLNTLKRNIQYNKKGTTAVSDITAMYFVLDRSDVIRINSIKTIDGRTDYSDRFLSDTGQRDAFYLLGRIYVKPEHYSKYAEGTSFSFVVSYDYYEHSGYGPFVADSYVGISYENIQVFVSPRTGKSVHLANAMDFRPQAKITGYMPSGNVSGATASESPSQLYNRPIIRYSNGFAPERSSIVQSHKAYLPRIDKLVVSKNIAAEDIGDITTLKRIAGIPSDSPIVPEDLNDSMTLFTLSIPAYTFNAQDIKAQTIGNNRFTMKDIGTISSRVDALEQQATLNDLEMSIVSKDLKTTTGVDALKRAILVDTFDGHSIGDVSDPDYRCSIDPELGELRASFDSNAYGFEYNGSDSGLTLTVDNILCASFTGTTLIYQNKASDTINVNSFSLHNWVGSIKTSPIGDYWYDNVTRPVVKNNDSGSNDAWNISNMNAMHGHGSQWNDWESIWNGISIEANEVETKKSADFFAASRKKNQEPSVEPRWYTSNKISRFTIPVDKLKQKYSYILRKKDYYANIGINTLLNRSISLYMRGKTITFNAYNMKPNTQMHVFLDNINVNNYCTRAGGTGPFVTDIATGSLETVVMSLPAGMFEAGDKILRLIDDANNVVENATTIAEATFYSRGTNPENPFGIASVRPVEIRKQTPSSSKVVSNPLYRKKSINTTKYNQWIDPVAQTFEINENENPYGTFLESVDIAIATKDKELPITVEICPVVNGVPHPSVILPFSTVVRNPSTITVNAITPTYTNFKFSSPVYLSPGQYAITVRSNSLKYTLFVANIGKPDIVTEETITSTFTGGILYKAQNASEPRGDANTDLMFRLNRCIFQLPSASVTLNYIDQPEAFTTHLIQPNVFAFTPPNMTITAEVVVGSTEYSATINRNLTLKSSHVLDNSGTLNLILNALNTASPLYTYMIDLDRTNVVAIKNIINSSENGTTIEQAISSGRTDSTARYITKKVSIPYGQSAKELKVIMDAYYPKGTYIRVYAKTFNSEHNVPDEVGYKRMVIDSDSEFYVGGQFTYSVNPQDFREISFSILPDANEKFNTFSAKISMYSDLGNEIKVPIIKNLRVVAIE